MTHDPMCDVRSSVRMLIPPYAGCERCELIARAREDERRSSAIRETDLYRDGYAAALRDAAEAVKAMNGWEESGSDFPPFTAVARDDAITEIEALGGER